MEEHNHNNMGDHRLELYLWVQIGEHCATIQLQTPWGVHPVLLTLPYKQIILRLSHPFSNWCSRNNSKELFIPNLHIRNFLQLFDTIKVNGASNDAIRLRFFPFSLWDKAKSWLQSQTSGSITTWDNLAQKFLAKYFPLDKIARMCNNITSFLQFDYESLYEAWEIFKDLLKKCPHHGLPKWLQVQTFYNGLSFSFRITILQLVVL